MPVPRFEVWDELGKLRAFYTEDRAKNFALEGMRIVVLPKLSKRERIANIVSTWEEAPF